MRARLAAVLAAALCAALVLPARAGGSRLTILFTNDVRGYVEPCG